MENFLILTSLGMVLLPLLAAVIAGLAGNLLGRVWTHRIVISLIAIAFGLAAILFNKIVMNAYPAFEHVFYTWTSIGTLHFDVAFLLDRLSATMVFVVLFVSLMVHVYTIGYMADDPGYQRFFSYMALFTFFMLILVMANNFLWLFVGWEGVGLVSYLLIGFWFKKESANLGSLKAFIVNRLGDVGFILAIAAILMYFESLDYRNVFTHVPAILTKSIALLPHSSVSAITVICFLLFFGAMAKSAQIPLHVWLPESMEGPTPISALIHAATMVTAGIYMVARMSPLFEYAPLVLSFIVVIGATTAFLMGLLAIVQNDIKRVIAYSTLSQLGYMVVALGVSAYDAAIFHLITHAFFKALLFLAAGSVIMAMHHEQDMQKMGGLAKYMPVTYITFVIGSLALCAIPPLAGFYSKDIIIESVQLSHIPGATYAYLCVLAGTFITAVYTFRALFLTFHTKERFDAKLRDHVQESPWVVLIPLVALAIPSVFIGSALIGPMIFSYSHLLGNSIFVLPDHQVITPLTAEFHGALRMALQAGQTLPFWLVMAGIVTAWIFTEGFPQGAVLLKKRFALAYEILLKKYGFDDFNQVVFVQGTQDLGHLCYDVTDVKIIDGSVNNSGRLIRWLAKTGRRLQTGYIYHYALSMVVGVLIFLVWGLGFGGSF